ncbi:MAG: prephenate dehydratase [Ignavibacteria bacterium]|nr:prephenate dehydratase [Ignavibacteria bacterium]
MKKKVFFQGEHGAFSEEAAFKYFGKNINSNSCYTFEQVFRSVRSTKYAYGIIPIENSLAGSLHLNYDLLMRYNLQIVGEINHRISHHLIGIKRSRIKDIKKIISHPVALQQCKNFIKTIKSIDVTETYDTAGSVKMLMKSGSINSAAIASYSASKLYGGKILKRNIEDYKENFTRFLLLSKKKVKTIGKPNKTSIVFTLKNESGILYKALSGFAIRGIDLTKIESRPIRERPFEYYFYLDFVGYIDDINVKNAIKQLRELTDYIKILGSYPKFMS